MLLSWKRLQRILVAKVVTFHVLAQLFGILVREVLLRVSHPHFLQIPRHKCNKEPWRGDFLFKDDECGLCMTGPDLDELLYCSQRGCCTDPPSEDAQPTLRGQSSVSAARKRYERQGILVSEVALEQAEAGCLADSELRALRRERDAENMIAISSLQ